jgi:hypothetical protein
MGSNNASGGGGGRTDAGPNRTTATKIGVGNITESGKKTKSYKSDNPDAFRNRGAEEIKKGVKGPPSVMLASAILSKPLQAGSKVTRDFFTDKVLGSKNYKNVSKTEFLSYNSKKQDMMYKNYINKRTSGQTDAYGNPINNRDNGGGNQVVTAPAQTMATATAPTNAEVSQSAAADASSMDTDDPLYKKRKTKRVGRSPTILTGVTGATGGLTLGKKSLLGIS